MTQKNYTHIIAVLDRSGSMEPLTLATIDGFNELCEEQRKLPGLVTMTVVLFANDYQVLHRFADLRTLPKLTRETYRAVGMTALYDAMARVIEEDGAKLAEMHESSRPEHVIVATITDGAENSSVKFAAALEGADRLRKIVEHQRDAYQWQFLYLGANQDAILAATAMGVPASHAVNYAATPMGTRSAYAATSVACSAMRTGTVTGNAPVFNGADVVEGVVASSSGAPATS